ncbi:unnamed protein product, partial [marine sediment metagenome]
RPEFALVDSQIKVGLGIEKSVESGGEIRLNGSGGTVSTSARLPISQSSNDGSFGASVLIR